MPIILATPEPNTRSSGQWKFKKKKKKKTQKAEDKTETHEAVRLAYVSNNYKENKLPVTIITKTLEKI